MSTYIYKKNRTIQTREKVSLELCVSEVCTRFVHLNTLKL